jgi:hypothetical protein
MCCVRNAAHGGETVFLDSVDLVRILKDEAPDLLASVKSTKVTHARSGDTRVLPIIRDDNGVTKVNWNYYCVADDRAEILALREEFFRFIQCSPGVKAKLVGVKLNTGDAVVWRDDEVLHGRNAFSASKASDRFLWKCALEMGRVQFQ